MTTTPRTYKVGDLVTPDPAAYGVPASTKGRVYRVTKVNPKNLKCAALDGGIGINFPPYALVPAASADAPALPTTTLLPTTITWLNNGSVVTLAGGFAKFGWTAETPLVVIADKGERINVAALFGSRSEYLRCARKSLTVRDAEWLLHRLAGR